MEYKRLFEILADAKRVHTKSISQVDFESNNKRHAIYLIQGGILTAVSAAYTFNLSSFSVPTSQQKRLIDEGRDLICFFDEGPETSRHVSAWFDGKVVERKTGNRETPSTLERAKYNAISQEDVKLLDKLSSQIKNVISEHAMHPTIHSMRASLSKSTHIFDYDNLIPKPHPYKPQDFGEMFVIPTLHSILLPCRSLQINPDDFELLKSHLFEIQNA